MTPQEKRMMLKRQLLKEELERETRSPQGTMTEPPIPLAGEADKPRFSASDSSLAGAAQGFGYDFLDELYGARRGVQDVLPFVGDHSLSELPDRYRARRDEAREYYGEAQKQHPYAYGGGYVGGAAAGAFVPGYNLGKAAKGGQAVAKFAPRIGAVAERLATPIASGTVAGFGASQGESFGDNVEDAAIGGAFAGGVTHGLGKLGLSGDKMRKAANEKAVKASGAMTNEFRQLGRSGLLDAQGDFLLRKGIVTPLASLEDVAERSGAVRQEAGERIGSIIDEIDGLRDQAIGTVREKLGRTPEGAKMAESFADQAGREFGYNFDNVAQGIEALVQRDQRIAASRFHRDRLLGLADEFRRIGAEGPGTLREGLRNKTEHRRLLKDVESLGEEYKQEVYDLISGELDRSVMNMERLKAGVDKLTAGFQGADDAARALPTRPGALDMPTAKTVMPELDQGARRAIDKFKAANRDYAASAVAEKTARNRLGNVQSNRDFGLTTALAGAAGFGAAGPSGGLALGAVNNFFRKYGSTLQASSYYKIANVLQAQPQAFGKYTPTLAAAMRRGPQQLIVTSYLIGKQDPEFKTFIDKLIE